MTCRPREKGPLLRGGDRGQWSGGEEPVAGDLPDLLAVEDQPAIEAMTVAVFLPEERGRVSLPVHTEKAIVRAQAPAAGVPLQAAADVAGQEAGAAIDAK